ncbi:hypothetical protein AURDEDRAFT_156143 [Auricularia subglabra TFB-10046 SS5]|nr:hypothetical protein AURDEDRAFT_156143 [Auricularia subglabra TFB-10046 SS5]
MSLLDLNIAQIACLHELMGLYVSNLVKKPLDEAQLNAKVEAVIAVCSQTSHVHWELFLRHEVVTVAATEGEATKRDPDAYYQALRNMLDLVLCVAEHGACEELITWTLLEDLLKLQTVDTCWHIFLWIESRAERVTKNLIPGKNKALALLRTLNELLRRLSKAGSTSTFCGRILIFLANVFTLGERSGVNLRGDYGPEWTPVPKPPRATPLDDLPADVRAAEERKEGMSPLFFREFWALQSPMARPQTFSMPETFPMFQAAVDTVLPVLAEATKRERALMGSKALNGTAAAVAAGVKRKREAHDTGEDGGKKKAYFFAKYLTSPELLDLEVADPQFRRQFLFQLLILLHHLSIPEPKKKEVNGKAPGTPGTSSTTPSYLDEAGSKWRKDVGGFLYPPILWHADPLIKWKSGGCQVFDKPPLPASFETSGRAKRRKLLEPPSPPPYSHGSAGLTEMWDRGPDDIERALEQPVSLGGLKDYAKRIQGLNMRVEARQKMLARMPGGGPKNDTIVTNAAEERGKLSWLALRVARFEHAHLVREGPHREQWVTVQQLAEDIGKRVGRDKATPEVGIETDSGKEKVEVKEGEGKGKGEAKEGQDTSMEMDSPPAPAPAVSAVSAA